MHDSVTADMFEPPIARKTDPVTSKKAAFAYTATSRGADKQLMLDTITNHPRHTAGEYSQILKDEGLDWFKAARMTTKRISDLYADGKLAIGSIRQCSKTKRSAQTYYVKSDYL